MKQPIEINDEMLFYRGHFDKIIKLRQGRPITPSWCLTGAWCLTGKPDTAENFLSAQEKSNILNLFFLALGWTRISEYEKAKQLLNQMLPKSQTPFERFVFAQAMAFYNYFICRFKNAERWILWAQLNLNQSLNHHSFNNLGHNNRPNNYKLYDPVFLRKPLNKVTSSQSDFIDFWKLLLFDLQSHIYIKRGKISLGFSCLEQALSIAKTIKNQFTVEAIEVSIAIYESTYGFDQSKSLSDLIKLKNKYKNSNQFYFYNLSLEYIRRLNLNGNLAQAEQELNKIKKPIFSSSLNRQKAAWIFKFSHLLYLQGKTEQALNQIPSALEFIKSKQDLLLYLQILGLKYKINKKLGVADNAQESEIKKLIFYCQDSQSLSYAYRFGWTQKPVTEDPHAHFFHQWYRQGHKNYNLLKKVINNHWFSLLADLTPTNRSFFIYLDVLPKYALLFDDQKIVLLDGLTQLIRQSLLISSKQKLSKADFVQLLWGYEYDSYRHDSLIYSLALRIREFLKGSSVLFEIKNNEIELIQTQVRSYEHELHNKRNEVSFKKPDDHQVIPTELNFRQIQILEYLEHNRSINVQQLSQLLQTSKITANRDLTSLLKQCLICKIGRGRATCYSLSKIQAKKELI